MWDEPIPSGEDENEPGYQEQPEPDQGGDVGWTDGQLMRLENEFRKAQRAFAYHPVIGIRPLRGDPPHEYQIDYRVRTLATNEAGDLQYVDEVSMHVWLPPGFPNQPPVVRPMAPVFHPNVAWEGVYLTRPWQPTDTLVTFAGRIGELLTFRSYDPESVVNAVAMDWLSENMGSLPLDTRADFSPFNGGEPLGRIGRFGPATLDQIRRALDDMRFALVAEEGAPTAEEVAEFSKQTRSAVSLFLDGDVPDNLRQQASEFDDWCRELPASVPWWEYLRQQRTRSAAAEKAAASLKNAADAFGLALDELERLVPSVAGTTPAAAVKLIPPMDRLEPLQLKLPPLSRDFDKFSLECKKLVAAMKAAAPEVDVAPEGSLGRRLAAQSETVKEVVAQATKTAESALAEVEPLYRRTKPELQALEQIVGWREYMDMFSRVRTLEKQLGDWGTGGVQAFYLDNASGTFGPFQFEEPLDLGDSRVVVRSLQRGQIEVLNAAGQDVIGRGTAGSVNVVIGKTAETPEGHQMTFRLSERCDDLVVQIGFIQQQTADALGQLQRPVAGAKSWCGTISTMLADPHQQQNLRDANRKAAHRWKAVIADLAALARFKERLATYHLVTRLGEELPRITGAISQAQTRHKDATAKISVIIGKSSRDVETDRLIVPPKLAKSYSEEMQIRDDAKREVAAMHTLMKQIARELAVRLGSSRLVGRPEIPAFHALSPLPPELEGLAGVMADEPMQEAVAGLGHRLSAQLPFKAPPVPQVTHVERPADPSRERPAHVPRRSTAPTPQPVEAEAQAEEATASEQEPAMEEASTVAEGTHAMHANSESEFDFTGGDESHQQEDEMIEGFFAPDPPPGDAGHESGPG